jgi:hypothetical protein
MTLKKSNVEGKSGYSETYAALNGSLPRLLVGADDPDKLIPTVREVN